MKKFIYAAKLLSKGIIFDGLSGLRPIKGHRLKSTLWTYVLPRLLRRRISSLKLKNHPSSNIASKIRRHINPNSVIDGAYLWRFKASLEFVLYRLRNMSYKLGSVVLAILRVCVHIALACEDT